MKMKKSSENIYRAKTTGRPYELVDGHRHYRKDIAWTYPRKTHKKKERAL